MIKINNTFCALCGINNIIDKTTTADITAFTAEENNTSIDRSVSNRPAIHKTTANNTAAIRHTIFTTDNTLTTSIVIYKVNILNTYIFICDFKSTGNATTIKSMTITINSKSLFTNCYTINICIILTRNEFNIITQYKIT